MSNESALTFSVADMTCGHCARTITSAVEAAFPGAKATADTTTQRVSVTGNVDARAVAEVIAAEDYSPVLVEN
jgi:copper chaperone